MDDLKKEPRSYFDLVFQELKKGDYRILDFGCGDGEFSKFLLRKTPNIYGYDVSESKIRKLKGDDKRIKWTLGKANKKLSYRSNFFDVVLILHVFEHVGDERRIISEIARILKKRGKLYLASPYKGLFSFLDPANFRYKYPNLHKLLYIFFLGKSNYKENYINTNRSLLGDITATRKEHKHYRESELREILGKHFVINKLCKFSLFQPILNMLNILDSKVRRKSLRPLSSYMEKLYYHDNRIKAGELSDNFFLVATKR